MTDWFEVFGHFSLFMLGVLFVLPGALLAIGVNNRNYQERTRELNDYYMGGRRRTDRNNPLPPVMDGEMVLMLSHEQWHRLPFEAKHQLRLLPMMDNGATYAVKLSARQYRDLERRLLDVGD